MNKRSTKFYRKNEKEVMERLGFKPTRNSGATWIDKGDGQSEYCLCELKSTDKRSYKFEQQTLHTLEANAIEAHKLPVFALQFLNTDEVWLSIKETDIQAFKELIKASVLEELKEEKENLQRILKPNCFGKKEEFNEEDFECYFNCNLYDSCKKTIDKQKKEEYIIREGVGGKVKEAVRFMPQTIDANKVKENILARKKYIKDKQKQSDMYLEKQKKKRKEKNKDWKRS